MLRYVFGIFWARVFVLSGIGVVVYGAIVEQILTAILGLALAILGIFVKVWALR